MAEEGESFGVCNKCGREVVGENNGCQALGEIYHTSCFVCCVCLQPLRGQQFYAIQDRPYCEPDYLETLDKCNVCGKPIVDRILRATGKAFHPDCFRCSVCDKVLDNVPFTVAAAEGNQILCIPDFHRKFAPRCSACQEPIVPEPGKTDTVRVVALERSFHVQCYKCEQCGLKLSSEAGGPGCYPIDGHVLCRDCNGKQAKAARQSAPAAAAAAAK